MIACKICTVSMALYRDRGSVPIRYEDSLRRGSGKGGDPLRCVGGSRVR